jgi:hypothetical protein
MQCITKYDAQGRAHSHVCINKTASPRPEHRTCDEAAILPSQPHELSATNPSSRVCRGRTSGKHPSISPHVHAGFVIIAKIRNSGSDFRILGSINGVWAQGVDLECSVGSRAYCVRLASHQQKDLLSGLEGDLARYSALACLFESTRHTKNDDCR